MRKKRSRPHNRTQARELQITPQPATPHPLEEQSWSAAIKSQLLTKWTLLLTIAGLLLTAAGIVIPIALQREAANGTPREKEQAISVSELSQTKATPESIVSQDSSAADSKQTSRIDQPNENNGSRNLAMAHVMKARDLYRQRHYPQALVKCDEALRLDPHNREAQNLKARIERTVQILAENDKPTH